MRELLLSFWTTVAGAILLYAFFAGLAQLSPAETSGAGFVVAALIIVFTLRNVRLSNEIANPAGDPHLRRDLNLIRERRGF